MVIGITVRSNKRVCFSQATVQQHDCLQSWRAQQVSKLHLFNLKGFVFRALSTFQGNRSHQSSMIQHKQSYWKSKENQKQLFDSIGKELGVSELDGWYKVRNTDFIKAGGKKLLNRHGSSLFNILNDLYPEQKWLGWKFENQPRRYWQNPENQKAFLEWYSQTYQHKSMEDWYQVTQSQITREGGRYLIHLHGSLYKTLAAVYPTYNWKPWKFRWAPRFFWNDLSNIHCFVQDLTEQLHITKLEDWYRVSSEQIYVLGARNTVERFGGLGPFLSMVYPHYPWEPQKFLSLTKKSTQRWLKIALQELFPHLQILEDYIPEFKSSPSSHIELDLFIPSLNLAIEYHGKQHYQDLKHFAPASRYQKRDAIKKSLCEQNQITLVEVPYWWNRKPETIAGLLHSIRPDLQFAIQPQPFDMT